MADIERIYTVPLSGAYRLGARMRARTAVKILRAFLARHMKAEPGNVKLSAGVNDLMWSHGMHKPPRRLKLKVSKDGEGIVRASLLEEKEVKKKEAAKPVTPVAGMPAEEHAGKKVKEAPPEKPAEKKPAEKKKAAKEGKV